MFQRFISLVRNLACFVFLFGLMFFSSNIKDSYYRDHIGDAVVRIYNLDKTTGGTGFHVEAPSGEVYILTNKHICELAQDNKLLIEKNGQEVIRNVITEYKHHDLCLVEAVNNPEGVLSVSNDLDVGDDVVLIGHPGLRDLTLSHGEFIGETVIQLPNAEIQSEKECKGTWVNNPILILFFGQPFICMEDFISNSLSAPSYGGNSGSPVVDKYGSVIGVLFAGSRQQVNDSYMVPLKYIKNFLKGF